MTIDRPLLRRLRTRMEETLASVGQDFGVDIKVGNASYTAANARFKVEVNLLSGDGQPISPHAENFKRYCTAFGLKSDDLNREFRHGDKVFRIVGLKLTSRKYPILAQSAAGKFYKFESDLVKARLA